MYTYAHLTTCMHKSTNACINVIHLCMPAAHALSYCMRICQIICIVGIVDAYLFIFYAYFDVLYHNVMPEPKEVCPNRRPNLPDARPNCAPNIKGGSPKCAPKFGGCAPKCAPKFKGCAPKCAPKFKGVRAQI